MADKAGESLESWAVLLTVWVYMKATQERFSFCTSRYFWNVHL